MTESKFAFDAKPGVTKSPSDAAFKSADESSSTVRTTEERDSSEASSEPDAPLSTSVAQTNQGPTQKSLAHEIISSKLARNSVQVYNDINEEHASVPDSAPGKTTKERRASDGSSTKNEPPTFDADTTMLKLKESTRGERVSNDTPSYGHAGAFARSALDQEKVAHGWREIDRDVSINKRFSVLPSNTLESVRSAENTSDNEATQTDRELPYNPAKVSPPSFADKAIQVNLNPTLSSNDSKDILDEGLVSAMVKVARCAASTKQGLLVVQFVERESPGGREPSSLKSCSRETLQRAVAASTKQKFECGTESTAQPVFHDLDGQLEVPTTSPSVLASTAVSIEDIKCKSTSETLLSSQQDKGPRGNVVAKHTIQSKDTTKERRAFSRDESHAAPEITFYKGTPCFMDVTLCYLSVLAVLGGISIMLERVGDSLPFLVNSKDTNTWFLLRLPVAIEPVLVRSMPVPLGVVAAAFVVALARRGWVSYTITTHGLHVGSILGFGTKHDNVMYSDITNIRTESHFSGSGDLVVFLRNGTKLEMKHIHNFHVTIEFILNYVDRSVATEYRASHPVRRTTNQVLLKEIRANLDIIVPVLAIYSVLGVLHVLVVQKHQKFLYWMLNDGGNENLWTPPISWVVHETLEKDLMAIALLTLVLSLYTGISLACRAWVCNEITTHGIRVTSRLFGKERANIAYDDIVNLRTDTRFYGDGDILLFLRDGSTFEMKHVSKFHETMKILLSHVDEDIAKEYRRKFVVATT